MAGTRLVLPQRHGRLGWFARHWQGLASGYTMNQLLLPAGVDPRTAALASTDGALTRWFRAETAGPVRGLDRGTTLTP
jgi:hypothetical protein